MISKTVIAIVILSIAAVSVLLTYCNNIGMAQPQQVRSQQESNRDYYGLFKDIIIPIVIPSAIAGFGLLINYRVNKNRFKEVEQRAELSTKTGYYYQVLKKLELMLNNKSLRTIGPAYEDPEEVHDTLVEIDELPIDKYLKPDLNKMYKNFRGEWKTKYETNWHKRDRREEFVKNINSFYEGVKLEYENLPQKFRGDSNHEFTSFSDLKIIDEY